MAVIEEPIKKGNYWTNIIADNNGQSINFEEVSVWIDGTPMNDTKCDGVIYRKLPSSVGGGYVRRVNDGSFVNAEWFGIKPGGDYTSLIQSVLNVYPAVRFKAGTYIISSTITLKSQSAIVGDVGQMLHNQPGKVVTFIANTATLGDGVSMFRCSNSPNTSQSILIENITFRGDTPADYNDLSTIPDEGVIAIDPSGVRDGLMIRNCNFRNLRCAIKTIQGHSYIDLTTLENCTFRYNRSCIEFSPTTGVFLNSCMFYDNYTIGEVNRIECIGCSFNNSSFSTNAASIRFQQGKFSRQYVEGYNNVFYVLAGGGLQIENSYFSETYSDNGGTKFYIRVLPDDVSRIYLKNVRFSVNTRIFNLNGFSDVYHNVWVTMEGCYGDSPFGHANSPLNYYTRRGLVFNGEYNRGSNIENLVENRAPILAGDLFTVRGSGKVIRFPYLHRKIPFVSGAINVKLTFPQELYNEQASDFSLDYAEFTIVGCNNGAGGNLAYFTKLYVYNGYGSVWGYHLSGPSESAYTVTLSETTNNSVQVLISETHQGSGDFLVVNGSTENGKIELLNNP